MPTTTVLHVRSSGGLFGADRVVLDLCLGLERHGVKAVLAPIVEPDGSGEALVERALEAGVTVRPMVLGHVWEREHWSALCRVATAAGAAIVHTHDYKSDLLAALGRGEWRRVSTLHGWVGTTAALRFKERIGAWLVRRFDRVVCVSEALAARERARGLVGVRVVHNGIDLRPFELELDDDSRNELARSLGLCRGVPVIGAVGRLSEEKGYDILLESVALLRADGRELEVLLVGDGPERRMLSRRAEKLGLTGAVHLPGVREDAARVYSLLDVFCMPSRREGLPLALLEAMAAGCAVVASPVGGIPEVLGGEEATGVSVPPGDAPALARAIGSLLDDPHRRAELGQQARDRVRQAFSCERMTESMASLYHELLG